MTAIFDSKMATGLAEADNPRVTTDGEIIVRTLQNLQLPLKIEKDSKEATFKKLDCFSCEPWLLSR